MRRGRKRMLSMETLLRPQRLSRFGLNNPGQALPSGGPLLAREQFWPHLDHAGQQREQVAWSPRVPATRLHAALVELRGYSRKRAVLHDHIDRDRDDFFLYGIFHQPVAIFGNLKSVGDLFGPVVGLRALRHDVALPFD